MVQRLSDPSLLAPSGGVSFSGFHFDAAQGRLWRGPRELRLRPKTLAVLRYLLARPGQVIGKDELIAAVWPGVHVSDAVLPVCINELRRALDDKPRAPSCIRTVHGRGYLFIAALAGSPLTRATPRPPDGRALDPRAVMLDAQPRLASLSGAAPPRARDARSAVSPARLLPYAVCYRHRSSGISWPSIRPAAPRRPCSTCSAPCAGCSTRSRRAGRAWSG